MPQLDPTYLISQLFWLSLCFGLFYFVIRSFIVPTLQQILEGRDHVKNDNMTRAHMIDLELRELKANSHKKSIEMSTMIDELKKESDEKFKRYKEKKLKEFKTTISEKIQDTEKKIADLKSEFVKGDLYKTKIASLSQTLIFKMSGCNPTDAEIKKLI